MTVLSSYEKYTRLAESLCCPICKGDVQFDSSVYCGSVLINAEILCETCGKCGCARNTKLIFNGNPAINLSSSAFMSGALKSRRIFNFIDQITTNGDWHDSAGRYWSEEPRACVALVTMALGVDLRLLKHPWAGIAQILIDGEQFLEVDLFEPEGSMELAVPVALDGLKHHIEIRVTGRKADMSHACQVFFCGYDQLEFEPSATPSFSQFSGNLGNPYPGRWDQLVAEYADEALILDCGSGDRRYEDGRVVNFEYSPFALPDVFGDGHHLPFKDQTFGLILSQAVIEHLYDPFAAAKELYRVTASGGKLLAESAFMQPLHAVPFHFFNTTKWGMERLFEDFHITQIEPVGTLSQTLGWIYSLVELPKEQRQIADQIIALANGVDAFISVQELEKFASFIRMEAYRA
ncbi:MAG: methyltransferase domain-containing protein [Novosphingobium sp.]|nr:methyltransferase domain-containing protein [Novosphingobium sp.]